MMIYQFTIVLADLQPKIWRRFQVNGSITFHQLHKTLQIVMGWEDGHLYQFEFDDRVIGIPDPDYPSEGKRELKSKNERVDRHFTREGQTGIYLYDFGDDWVHQIELEKILSPENGQTYPICVEGERACPPEDVGGLFGFLHLMEILAQPNHPEYPDMSEWIGEDYQPEYFDLAGVNRQLQKWAGSLNPKQTGVTDAANKPIKLTAAKLKKELQSLSQQELIGMIAECFKLSKDVERFLTVKFLGDEAVQELFHVYQKKVKDEFYPDRGHGKLRLAEAKKAIQDFEKITRNKRLILELRLFYVEMGVAFTNDFGDIDERYYMSMEDMYASVIKLLNEEETPELFEEYAERILNVVEATDGIGWGFHDALGDIYYDLKWIQEDM